MSDQLNLFATAVVPAPSVCWCVESDLWGGGKFCAAARKLEVDSKGTLDHTNALRVAAASRTVCEQCGKEHDDGAWLICDHCVDGDEPGFRAYLKGLNPFYGMPKLHDEVVGVFAGLLLAVAS